MNFPRRNRLISGLAAGVLVVEAAVQSGRSSPRAMRASRAGGVRDPGLHPLARSSGMSPADPGGAKLVETAADVLEELGWPGPRPIAIRRGSAHVVGASALRRIGRPTPPFDTLVAGRASPVDEAGGRAGGAGAGGEVTAASGPLAAPAA